MCSPYEVMLIQLLSEKEKDLRNAREMSWPYGKVSLKTIERIKSEIDFIKKEIGNYQKAVEIFRKNANKAQ